MTRWHCEPFGPDGMPLRPSEPAAALPCVRCGCPVEAPIAGSRATINGRDVFGPQCDGCFRLMMWDHERYWIWWGEFPEDML